MRRLAVAVVLVSTLAFAQAPLPASAAPEDWCTGGPPPCVVSATRNGETIPPSSTEWDVDVLGFTIGASTELSWTVWKGNSDDGSGDLELGASALSDVWTITFETGGFTPRVVFTRGQNVTVSRSGTQVTVTASPVTVAGDCDTSSWPWTCPSAADPDLDRDAYLGGNVTDYGEWENAAQRNAMNGMDYNTNVDSTSLPPEIVNDPATGDEQLLIRLANPHFRADGSTVFTGLAHLRIPNQFLKKVYGIDHPASLTSSGLVVSGTGGGTSSVTQESGGEAMIVDLSGLTFSAKKVKIRRGKVTPAKPTDVRARRRGSSTVLRFEDVDPRGSRITGYEGRCGKGASAEYGKSKRSPVRVQGGSGPCKVRALSKAGPGKWSKKAK